MCDFFDEQIYNLSRSYIKENTIIIDAGANYGQMSILFSKVKKDVSVYSFESSKYIYDILVRPNLEGIDDPDAHKLYYLKRSQQEPHAQGTHLVGRGHAPNAWGVAGIR